MSAPANDVQRLESERLRPSPHDDQLQEAWHKLLDLIAGECRRAGMLP